MVVLLIMVGIGILGVNQSVSIVIMLVSGYFIQKTVDGNKKGYIIHLACKMGILRFFQALAPFIRFLDFPFGKFRI